MRYWLLCFFTLALCPVGQAQKARPNIIWIVAEDLSPHMGCYGDPVVKTPNIDQLAKEGVRYTRAFATAGVCAPSRSAIITGMYQTSIGTHHMRTLVTPALAKYSPVPSYSAMMPMEVKCFTSYLRNKGYYCTNNEKQDYQFEPPASTWDENGPAAGWRNRPKDAPFFAVFNFFKTHESQLFPPGDKPTVDEQGVVVPPYYPATPMVKKTIAQFLTNVETVDRQVGELIAQLKADGLYDNTIIFFYGDHGDALPWAKREMYDRGVRVPLIVRFPGEKFANTVNESLVSLVDLGPSVLSLAHIPLPRHMQGKAFLGDAAAAPRQYVFAARDRMDTEYDRVRMVRDQRYKYVRNFMPDRPNYQAIEFRLGIPMMKEILALREEGKLNADQARWFSTKPGEELYDLETDPDELHNLLGEVRLQNKLKELRGALDAWLKETGDLGAMEEKEMLRQWWGGASEAPAVAAVEVKGSRDKIALSTVTPGAVISYQIRHGRPTTMHTVMTWDFGALNPKLKNGQLVPASPAWVEYHEPLQLQPGDTLDVRAWRSGYKESVLRHIQP